MNFIIGKRADDLCREAYMLQNDAYTTSKVADNLVKEAERLYREIKERGPDEGPGEVQVRERTSKKKSPKCKNLSHLKKYRERHSPPYSANKCPPGIRKLGNDGKRYYTDPNKNGINTWRLLSDANDCPPGTCKLENDGKQYYAAPNRHGINTWRLLGKY